MNLSDVPEISEAIFVDHVVNSYSFSKRTVGFESSRGAKQQRKSTPKTRLLISDIIIHYSPILSYWLMYHNTFVDINLCLLHKV